MIIKTITCHDVYNHGASLQAFALQRYLSSKGHEVEIIDYKPDYLSRHYLLTDVNPAYDKPLVKWLYILAKLPGRLLIRPRKWAFDLFRHKYLRCTGKRYRSNEELKADPPKADAYIAGSDQIWNTLFPNGKDPAFYLDFAPTGTKKISFSASFASKSIDPGFFNEIARRLASFDAVAVREESTLPLLSALGRPDGVATCDPCFLLSAEEWSAFARGHKPRGRYLLVYDFEDCDIIRNVATQIAVQEGLKIYNIGPRRLPYADRNYLLHGPRKFIQLVRNAEYIVSNSFHATAFSILFKRPFCVIQRTEQINERMISLLSGLNLDDRIVDRFTPTLLEPIDYEQVTPLLASKICSSKRFLSDSLQ